MTVLINIIWFWNQQTKFLLWQCFNMGDPKPKSRFLQAFGHCLELFDHQTTLTMFQCMLAQVMEIFSTSGTLQKFLWTTQWIIWIPLVVEAHLAHDGLIYLWQLRHRMSLHLHCFAWIDRLSFCTSCRSSTNFVNGKGWGFVCTDLWMGGEPWNTWLSFWHWVGLQLKLMVVAQSLHLHSHLWWHVCHR